MEKKFNAYHGGSWLWNNFKSSKSSLITQQNCRCTTYTAIMAVEGVSRARQSFIVLNSVVILLDWLQPSLPCYLITVGRKCSCLSENHLCDWLMQLTRMEFELRSLISLLMLISVTKSELFFFLFTKLSLSTAKTILK